MTSRTNPDLPIRHDDGLLETADDLLRQALGLPPGTDDPPLGASPGCAAHEAAAAYRHNSHPSERHLQCVWSDEKLRPRDLAESGGEPVEVVSAGRWTLEAGPDFLDAVLLVGRERRRLLGDVEIHIHPREWRQHGHSSDENYTRVIAHVTYLPGPRTGDGLPPGVLRISLREPLQRCGCFSFDDIDLAAYPHAVIPRTPRPCARALGNDPDRAAALLLAAGRQRIERKRQRLLAHLEQTHDPHQTFYEAFMAALGGKRNKQAFRLIAQRLPLADWPEGAGSTVHYARLLMAAGLLPDAGQGRDDASRALIRRLWDAAWRHPANAPSPAAPIRCRLGATRPANHPARRLAVAAALFGGAQPIEAIWKDRPFDPPERWIAGVVKGLIARATLEIWNNRLTLTESAGSATPVLLGTATAAMLVTNVIVPHIACTQPEEAARLAFHLPSEEIDAPMRTVATQLFGRDHNPALYSRHGLMQQGLLQIFNDFCLNAHNGCTHCRLAEALAVV